ncbi:hypothetical protein MRX96_006145 [Rhipicephalus microplus]
MDSSSRQSEILEQLDKIRRELARKERKLQKLKRLSAQKRSCDSSESSSVIDVEETRSSVSLDLHSPLRPIETTLSQREICHSKPLRTTDPQERSILLRGANSRALEADENVYGLHSPVDTTRAGIGESACDARRGEVQLSRGSACGRASPSYASLGPSEPEQQKPPSSDECRLTNERSPAGTIPDTPLNIDSRLSLHLVSPANSANVATAGARLVPVSSECSPVGKELDSATSVNFCKSRDVRVLNTTGICSPAVRHRVSQDESTLLGNVSVQQIEKESKCTVKSLLSSVRGKESSEETFEAFAYERTNNVSYSEKRFNVQSDVHLMPTLDGESSNDNKNVHNSQMEMFLEHEEHMESRDTECSMSSWDEATEGSTLESSEMTEPPWQATETSCSTSSKSWSPAHKRRRTTCEVTAPSGPADSKCYNFRKRNFSYSPLVRRRMSREAKSILGTFQKLIQHVRELPVSTFERSFEELGLHPQQEGKSVSNSEKNVEISRTPSCGILSPEKCHDETEIEVKESTKDDKSSVLETANTSRCLESFCAALSLLPRKKTEAIPNATNCEKRKACTSQCQRRESSLLASSACRVSDMQQSIVTSTATMDHFSSVKESSSSPLVHSVCNAADSYCDAAVDTVQEESLYVCEHASPEAELTTGAELTDNQAEVVPRFGKHGERTEPSGPLRIVCEVGDSCEDVEQSAICVHVNREPSDHCTNTATSSCEIMAVKVQSKAGAEVRLQDNGVCGNLLTERQEPGDPVQVTRLQNSDTITKQVSPALAHDSECDNGDGVFEAACLDNSDLFTQSEESDGTTGGINEFVATIVEQLDPHIFSAADCGPADEPQGSLSGSTTADDLNLPESQARSLVEAREHPSPSRGQRGLLTETTTKRFKTKEESPGSLTDKLQNAVLPSPSCTFDKASDHPLCIAVLASRTGASKPGLLDGSEMDGGTGTADVRSFHCAPPVPAAGATRTEELSMPHMSGTVFECVAKNLFTDSSVGNKASVANSDLPELLDPHELEGMFDEWSEGVDCVPRTLNARDARDCGNTSCTPGAHKECQAIDVPAAAGNGIRSSADHASVPITHGELNGVDAMDVLSQSLQRHHLDSPCDTDVEDANCENYSQGAEVVQKVECGSPDSALRSSIEVERKLPSEDQCSQTASCSLEALSAMSRFSDEVEEKDAVPHPDGDEQLGCEDLDSPELSGGTCDGLAEDDHDGAGWDNQEDEYEEQCQGTARPCGSLLGTGKPLLLFCALKCEEKQPVIGVHLVQAAAHPFLVTVQVSAINVWHLEGGTQLAAQHGHEKVKVGTNGAVDKGGVVSIFCAFQFPVEEDYCLLSCDEWTVLVYQNARVPLYLSCLEWRTKDAQENGQLLLTLGSLDSANLLSPKRSQRIYRIAKLSQESRFATALRTKGGATLLRVHRLLHLHGELGDKTHVLGRTSNLLDSLVCVEGQPDALLGNSANIFYVWDCNSRALVKKMIHEPDVFTDLHRISWCSSDRGLLFVLMQSLDEVDTTLVAMNPFSCKAEPVTSLSWKLAAKQRTGGSRSCSAQVKGRYVACVARGYGVRIWNLFTGNPVANMWYRCSTSVAMAELSGSMACVVGTDDGRVLVFSS